MVAHPRSGSLTVCLLVFHDALSLVIVPGGDPVNVGGDDGAAGLLQLQEDHVVRLAALAESQIGPQPDGADPDHLVHDVDEVVAAHDAAPVSRQRLQIVVQRFCDLLVLVLRWSADQWVVLDDAAGPVVVFGQPGQCPVTGAPLRSFGGVLDLLAQGLSRRGQP
jgi:hypothetical protein